jgi:hypothetical protein
MTFMASADHLSHLLRSWEVIQLIATFENMAYRSTVMQERQRGSVQC